MPNIDRRDFIKKSGLAALLATSAGQALYGVASAMANQVQETPARKIVGHASKYTDQIISDNILDLTTNQKVGVDVSEVTGSAFTDKDREVLDIGNDVLETKFLLTAPGYHPNVVVARFDKNSRVIPLNAYMRPTGMPKLDVMLDASRLAKDANGNNLNGTIRWLSRPTVYIDTSGKRAGIDELNGRKINPKQVDYIAGKVNEVLPLVTNGYLHDLPIEIVDGIDWVIDEFSGGYRPPLNSLWIGFKSRGNAGTIGFPNVNGVIRYQAMRFRVFDDANHPDVKAATNQELQDSTGSGPIFEYVDKSKNIVMPDDSASHQRTTQISPTTLDILAGKYRYSNGPVNMSISNGGSVPYDVNTQSAIPLSEVLIPGDYNRDGRVDFSDFLDFARVFGNENPFYDLNGDGRVNFADFIEFSKNFGRTRI